MTHWLNYLKTLTKVLIPLLAFFLTVGSALPPQKMASLEYQVKAVFLFNFAQFVEWPGDAFPGDKSPIIIGVLGNDPFGTFLDETVLGEEINGHPLVVERYTRVSEVKNCHILFIHADLAAKPNSILKNLKGKGILTVSDANNFAKAGGMIRFFTLDNKIKIRINLEAVKEEHITISSKLLRIAEIVEPNQ